MTETPNTIGVILLFVVVFLGCILWATGVHADSHHAEEQDAGKPGKDH
jgi:hypothetical protein